MQHAAWYTTGALLQKGCTQGLVTRNTHRPVRPQAAVPSIRGQIMGAELPGSFVGLSSELVRRCRGIVCRWKSADENLHGRKIAVAIAKAYRGQTRGGADGSCLARGYAVFICNISVKWNEVTLSET
jgi:hypothetical protein